MNYQEVDAGCLSEIAYAAMKASNKLIKENFGLCTKYYQERQIQYEYVLEDENTPSLSELFTKMDDNSIVEVQSYRQRLFNENSVIEKVNSQDSGDG